MVPENALEKKRFLFPGPSLLFGPWCSRPQVEPRIQDTSIVTSVNFFGSLLLLCQPPLYGLRDVLPENTLLLQADQVPIKGELKKGCSFSWPISQLRTQVGQDLLQSNAATMALEVRLQQTVRSKYKFSRFIEKGPDVLAMEGGPVSRENVLNRPFFQKLNCRQIAVNGVVGWAKREFPVDGRVAIGLYGVAGECGLILFIVDGQVAC